MHAVARQGIQVSGQGRYQRFTFTGAHLGDFALVQHNAADHLDIKMAHTKTAHTGFAHGSEGFWQQIIEAGTTGQATSELIGLGAQCGVVEGFVLLL